MRQYVEDVAQYSIPQAKKMSAPYYILPQQQRTPYYTNIIHPQPMPTKVPPANSLQQKQQAKKEEQKIIQEKTPVKKEDAESELESITKETVQLDFKKEEQQKNNVAAPMQSQQQKTLGEQENQPAHQRISLIKESETKQTVVFAELTKDFYQLAEPPLTEEEHRLLIQLEKDLAVNKEIAKTNWAVWRIKKQQIRWE